MSGSAADPALRVEAVTVSFPTTRDWLGRVRESVTALDGVSLEIPAAASLGLIGESGSGKTTLARVVLGMQSADAGAVYFAGRQLRFDRSRAARRRRSEYCQIVFQDPRTSLDPRLRVWEIMAEGLAIRGGASRPALRRAVDEMAAEVGISARALGRYPHELSGGQRQRVAIGRALLLRPRLLILDEPTSALDVTIQAQVLNVLMDLQARQDLAYLFISHDVSVIRHLCDRVAVLYRGRIVETGRTRDVLEHPQDAYTRKLIEAVPRIRDGGQA